MARVKAKLRLSGYGQYAFTTIYDEFYTYCENKNLRPDTLRYYGSYRKLFEYFYLTSKPTIESFMLADITPKWIDSLIKYLREERQNKPVTINTCLRVLKAFVTFASERGYMEAVPVKKLIVDEESKEPYTQEELTILLKKPQMKKSNFLEYRNWVLINYMLGTGNRIGSIVEIRNQDVDLLQGVIYLQHTKNRKRQVVNLTPSLVTILREYMQIRKGSPSDYLFCNQSGEKLRNQAIVQAIHKYNVARGVSKTSCHLFRHTFALSWLKNGGGVVELQKILGHSDITMTMRYVNMLLIDVSETIAQYNPLEKLTVNRTKTMFIKK